MSWDYKSFIENSPNFPLAEALGGSFAALIFLYVIINLFSSSKTDTSFSTEDIKGISQFQWAPEGVGYVISCYSDKIRIEETGEVVYVEDINRPGSRFLKYSYNKYSGQYSNLVFLIYSGSTETFLEARRALMDYNSKSRISFILLNKEMQKALYGNPIPAYFQSNESNDSLIVKYREDYLQK